MKIFGACVIALCLGSALAQPIYLVFQGERPLLKWKDVTDRRERCGDYFLYDVARNQQFITAKVQLTERDKQTGVSYDWARIYKKNVLVKLADEKNIPTAEWVHPPTLHDQAGTMLIRISRRDYNAASCLPNPQN